jgi:hypothetical protein
MNLLNKILLGIALCACITTQAQVAETIVAENEPLRWQITVSGIYPTRLYTNGVQFKAFTISDLSIVTNTPGTTNAYTISVVSQGVSRGRYDATARVFDPELNTESGDSPIVPLKTKPGKPWIMRVWQLL